MSLYQKSYERALKRYDKDLFVARNNMGVLCVFKKTKRFVSVCETENFKLLNLSDSVEYVFAITSTWGMNGQPRDYGIDDILFHIQKIDSLANKNFLAEMDAANAKVDEARDRSLKNELEGMLAYEKKRFQRAFDEIAPISRSMDKSDNKKRLKEKNRRIKDGNY